MMLARPVPFVILAVLMAGLVLAVVGLAVYPVPKRPTRRECLSVTAVALGFLVVDLVAIYLIWHLSPQIGGTIHEP